MDINNILAQLVSDQVSNQDKAVPPVEDWDPPYCGEMPLLIKANGEWWHAGTPFTRAKLVQLFSSVLKREGEAYFLVTPVEKIGIQVEDVPFIIVDSDIIVEDAVTRVSVKTQVGDHFYLDEAHPLELRQYQDHLLPYVCVRRNLWARLHQNVLYRWLDQAEIRQHGRQRTFWLKSQQLDFCIGKYTE